MSARTNTPGAAKAMEELEETVAQEEGRTYHTGSKGRDNQKGGKKQWSTTRTGANAIANPEESQIEEDTAQNGCHKTQGAKAGKKPRGSFKQDTYRLPTAGAPDQSEQGGSKKKGRGYQVTWKAKVWKNLKKCFKRDSQAKDTPDRSKTREERKEQDSYRRPTTGTPVKPDQERTERAEEEQTALPERKPAASRIIQASKDKKNIRRSEASRLDTGN